MSDSSPVLVTANVQVTSSPTSAESGPFLTISSPGSGGVSGTPSVQNSTWLSPYGLPLFGFVGVTRSVSPNVSNG